MSIYPPPDPRDPEQPTRHRHLALCRWLLAATGASRTTIRLVGPTGRPELVAEARAEGVRSIRHGTQVDPTVHPTYRHLERTRTVLIQPDTRTHPIRPPSSLVSEFRVYAQMLAPIVRDDRLTGVVSVHVQDRPHRFDRTQISALCTVRRQLCTDAPYRTEDVRR